MSLMEWPATLDPAIITVIPPGEVLSTGKALSGSTQEVPARRPPFGVTLDFSNLFDSQVLAWRAMAAHLAARGRVRVPLFDALEPSDAQIGAATSLHSDGTPFSDGTPYARTDIAGVTASVAAGMRNASIDFGDYGPILKAGQYFNLGDDPHIAKAVFYEGSVASIQFESAAKRTHSNVVVSLRASMIAKLADGQTGAIALDYGRYGAPQIELVEALDGPFS